MALRVALALASAGLLLGAAAVSTALAERRDDPLVRYQWHLAAIGAPDAWTVSRGAGVTVAVLDTGVAYENRGPYRRAPELEASRLVAGYDFVDDDPHPDDVPPPGGRRSHGTQIATIIGATAGNGIGGAGVAPQVSIMPIRVLDPELNGSARSIARGLRFAADHGADVANLSIAGAQPSRVLRSAVRYAAGRGVTLVAASGNGGRSSVSWPAAYPEVIAVGGVGRDRRLTYYSNHGRALDLVAPAGAGADVATGRGPSDGIFGQTLLGEQGRFCFCRMASTSAAAAEVSGVAALLIGARRATTPSEVRAVLRATARDLGAAGPDREYGAGLVQADAAVAGGDGTASAARPVSPDEASPRAPWAALGAALAAALAAAGLLLRRRGRASAGSGSSS